MNDKNKLHKKNHNAFRVCSQLSELFKCDVWLFRIIFILLTIINYKAGLINYIAFSLVMSNKRPQDY